jgi:hypothetical protein
VASRGCGSQPYVPRGPGSRPPGTTTWLRGARCTDPEEMPEKEAQPPAQNRHGGAPRGARPDRKGRRHPAGCPAYRVTVGQPGAAAPGRLSALRHSSSGWQIGKANSGSEKGVASREEKEKGETRNEKERFFVGWAKAHAEQWMAAPQTRSRAPCPRGRAIERADGVGTALR